MYELKKKTGKVLTSKSVGPGHSSYAKIFVNVSKISDPDDGLRKLQYATRCH